MTVVVTPSIVATGCPGIGILGSSCSRGCTAIRDLRGVRFIGALFRDTPSPGRLLMYTFLGPGSIIRPVMHNRPPRPKTPFNSTITALSARRDFEIATHARTICRTLTSSLSQSHQSPRIRPSSLESESSSLVLSRPPAVNIYLPTSYTDQYSSLSLFPTSSFRSFVDFYSQANDSSMTLHLLRFFKQILQWLGKFVPDYKLFCALPS